MKKKILATALVATMALSIVACGDKKETKTTTEATTVEATTEVIATADDATASDADAATATDADAATASDADANLEEYTDLGAAEEVAGFEFTIPEKIGDASQMHYMAGKNEMMVTYSVADESDFVVVRKISFAQDDDTYAGILDGINEEDYTEVNEVQVGNNEVYEYGADGKVELAFWYTEENVYSIAFENPITADELAKIVEEIQ